MCAHGGLKLKQFASLCAQQRRMLAPELFVVKEDSFGLFPF